MNKNRRYDLSGRSAVTSYRLCRLWGEAAALSQLVEFCVFQRGGEPIDERQVSPLVMPQISSTELRRDLRQGRVMESGLPAALKPF